MNSNQATSKLVKKPKSRETILNAALEVIALEGVDAITHRRVGKQSDLSNGVVSYHFPTRDDLINETFLFHLQQLEKLGEDINSRQAGDKLSDFLEATVEFVKRDQAMPHLVRADYELILYAARRPTLAKIVREWEDALASNIALELKSFGIRNSQRCARIVINLVRAYELECMLRPELGLEEFRFRLQAVVSGFLA